MTHTLIELTRGYRTIVDATDYDELIQFRWHVYISTRKGSGPYAVRTYKIGSGRTAHEWMHRRLLPGAQRVDHIDGDGLNNRRLNLRAVTNSQNMQNRSGLSANNTSGFRGVQWDKRDRRWRARIGVEGERIYLGYFDTAEEAARAFDRAALDRFGQFAGYLNFPDECRGADA